MYDSIIAIQLIRLGNQQQSFEKKILFYMMEAC